MDKLVLSIPTLYGDHHTTAVRAFLNDLEGVKEVYASSAFRQVEVSYDKKKISPEQIEALLAEQGYDAADPESAYPASAAERINRHTAAFSGVGDTISFTGPPAPYEGRPLWPCPGFTIESTKKDA
jgi:copper chaperone CopZ